MHVSKFRIGQSDKRRDLIKASNCDRQGVKQVELLWSKDRSPNTFLIEHVILEDRVRQYFKGAIIIDKVDMSHGTGSLQTKFEPPRSHVQRFPIKPIIQTVLGLHSIIQGFTGIGQFKETQCFLISQFVFQCDNVSTGFRCCQVECVVRIVSDVFHGIDVVGKRVVECASSAPHGTNLRLLDWIYIVLDEERDGIVFGSALIDDAVERRGTVHCSSMTEKFDIDKLLELII